MIIMLLIISFIDIKKMIIPDSILFLGFTISFTYLMLCDLLDIDNFLGAIVGFIIFLAIALITNAMGGGDIKLMTLIGFVFGVRGVLFITILSFVIGAIISILLLVFKRKQNKDNIAFGPFISLATAVYICYGIRIIELYIDLLF